MSKERDGMMSPDVQRAAITTYCESRGYTIVDWLEGLDESGSRAKSAWWPRLDQAVGKVEAGDVDVIVVWKFSRTARHRLKWAIALDAVDTAGGRLESATEQVDATTSTGRFTRGMLAELNAFEAERIGEGWKEVHQSRLARGLVPNGNPRFGYTWDRESGLHHPHPVDGPALRQAYERVVAGESFYSVVQWMNRRGLTTVKGGPWTSKMLIRVMDNGFGSGRILWGGALHDGIHEPVIPPDLWQAYLDRRAANRNVAPRTKSSQYVLSGMVKCARCKGPMGGGASPQGPRFRCSRNRDHGHAVNTGCTGGYVQMSHVEAAVLEWLEKFNAAAVDEAARLAGSRRVEQVSADVEGRRAAEAVARVDQQLKTLTRQLTEERVPEDVYVSVRDELLLERAGYVAQVEDLARVARRASVNKVEVAQDLLDGWRHLQVSVRRTMLATLVDRVEVETARARGLGIGAGGASRARVEIFEA